MPYKYKKSTFIDSYLIFVHINISMRVCILLICGELLHDRHISPRGDVWVHRLVLLMCLYEAVKVRGQCVTGIDLVFFYDFCLVF